MRRAQQAVAGRAHPEIRVGVHGQQRDVREAEQRVEEGQADQAREYEVVADEAQPLDELREDAPSVARFDLLTDVETAVERERGARGDRRQPEADRSAEGGDQDAGDRRTDHPAGLPGDRAEGDRVRQPLAIDQLRHERHPAGLVERAKAAAERGEHEQVLDTRESQHDQDEGEDQGRRRQGRRHEQEPPTTGAIGQDTGEELEHDERRALRQAEIAEMQRVARQLPRHPREGDVLRPMAEDVEDQSRPVEGVVPSS